MGHATREQVAHALAILSEGVPEGEWSEKRIHRANGVPRPLTGMSDQQVEDNEIRKEAFLACYEHTGYITRAAEMAMVHPHRVKAWRDGDPEFADAFDNAHHVALVKLEDEARRRAFEGIDEPVFFRGEEVGVVRRYSDTLLMFLLKAAAPEKYRERASLELTRGIEPPSVVEIHHDVTEETYAALLADPNSGVERNEQDHSDDRGNGVGEDVLRSKMDMEENE